MRCQRSVVQVRPGDFDVTQCWRLEPARVQRVERDVTQATIRRERVQLGAVVRGDQQREEAVLGFEVTAGAVPQEQRLATVLLPGEALEAVGVGCRPGESFVKA